MSYEENNNAVQQPPIPDFNANAAKQQHTASALSIMDIIGGTSVGTVLSEAASAYIHTLKECIESASNKVSLTVRTLSHPVESAVVYDTNGNAFVLIMAESYFAREEDDRPTIYLARPVMEAARRAIGQLRILNVIVVTKQDYAYASVMASVMINAFISLTDSNVRSFDITSFKNSIIEVSTNSSNYDRIVQGMCPHGVAARNDIRLSFYLTDKNNRNYNNNNNPNNFNNPSTTPFAAVAVYTTFTYAMCNGATKFVPKVHISEIYSSVQSGNIIPIILAITASVVIDSGLWKNQFSDLGPNSPNIGNLISDTTTGAPLRADNAAMRDSIIASHCTSPILVLDVTEGRWRIPELALWANPANGSELLARINHFLDLGNMSPISGSVIHTDTTEYNGIFHNGSEVGDTRWIDYLNTMIHNSSSVAESMRLLNQYSAENESMRVKKIFFPDITSHYVTTSVILMPEVLRALQSVVQSKILISANQMPNTNILDTQGLAAIAASYGNGSVPLGNAFSRQGLGFGYGPSLFNMM